MYNTHVNPQKQKENQSYPQRYWQAAFQRWGELSTLPEARHAVRYLTLSADWPEMDKCMSHQKTLRFLTQN